MCQECQEPLMWLRNGRLQCRSWSLFYSVNILPNKFLKHWMLLVAAIFLFLKENISQRDSNIIQFVQEISSKGTTHLPLSVFCFEGQSSRLTRLCHGTTYVPTQVAHQFTTHKFIPVLLKHSKTRSNIC